MSRKTLSAVALSAATLLLLSGCSSDDDTEAAAPEASAAAQDTAAEGRVLSADELKKALITAEDVPAGYTAQGPMNDDDVVIKRTSDDPACQALLDDFGAFEARTTDAATANTLFANQSAGTFVAVQLESYEGDKAAEGIAKMTEMYETCETWTEDDGSGPSEVTAAALSMAALGDETFASEVVYEQDGERTSGHLAVTRVGKSVSFLYVIADDADVADTEQIARASADKLEKASVA